MYYDNINISHQLQKSPVLEHELDRSIKLANINTVIVNGLQSERKDTLTIVNKSHEYKIKCYGIEMNPERAKWWKYYPVNTLQADADKFVISNAFNEVIKNNRVFIYDNLSGGKRVLERIKAIIKHEEIVSIAIFSNTRGSIREKLIEILDKVIEYSLSPTEAIIFSSKYLSGKYENIVLYNRNNEVFNKRRETLKILRGMHCPKCGNDWGHLTLRKDGNIHCCKNKYRKTCGLIFKPAEAQMLSDRELGIIHK